MSIFVAVFREFIFGALDLIRSTNAHSVKLLTAETIWLIDQIQYVHTPPIKSNMSTHLQSNPICPHTAPHQVPPQAPVKSVCFTINEIPEREMVKFENKYASSGAAVSP